jgi:hypothetical protein
VALALIALFDVAVARDDRIWDWTFDGTLLERFEEKVIGPAEDVRVVVLGSSRARDAVPPRVLERELGLPAGSVLNLSPTSGTPFDGAWLYRRNRERLRRAEVLVVGVSDWYCSAALAPTARDRRLATWEQRAAEFQGWNRFELVLGSFWRACDARLALRAMLIDYPRDPPRAVLREDGRPTEWAVESLEDRGPPVADSELRVEQFHDGQPFGLGRIRQLERLLAMAREDGVPVLIVDFPQRGRYVDAVRSRYPEKLDRYRAAVRALARPDGSVRVHLFEDVESLGIPATELYDYGHFTPHGARLFLPHLVKLLREE